MCNWVNIDSSCQRFKSMPWWKKHRHMYPSQTLLTPYTELLNIRHKTRLRLRKTPASIALQRNARMRPSIAKQLIFRAFPPLMHSCSAGPMQKQQDHQKTSRAQTGPLKRTIIFFLFFYLIVKGYKMYSQIITMTLL